MHAANQVALYLRVSTQDQVEAGYSLEAQETVLRDDVKRRGKFIYKVYTDAGISGIKEDRKAFNELMRDARKGYFGEVLVWTVSRISRKLSYFLKIIEELRKRDIEFRSITERFDATTPIGQFSLTMMGAVAQMQRESWMESSRLGIEQRAKAGRYNGELMLGYQRVPDADDPREGNKLVIVPNEAAIVEKIFSLYASGKGYKAIVNCLNEEAQTGKGGKAFSINAIKTILSNPFYIGKVRCNDKITEGVHEAIISQELWKQAQERIAAKSKAVKKEVDHDYLLSGVLRCPECGGGMLPIHTKLRRKDGTFHFNYYYACSAYLNKGKTICRANSVRAGDAEEKVLEWLKEILTSPFWISKVTETICQSQKGMGAHQEVERSAIDNRLAEIAKKQKQILMDYENGIVSRDTFLLDAQVLKVEKQELLENLEMVESANHKVKWAVEEIKATFYQFRSILKKASTGRKKELIRALVAKIHVNDSRQVAELELKVPIPLTEGNQEMLLILPIKKAE